MYSCEYVKQFTLVLLFMNYLLFSIQTTGNLLLPHPVCVCVCVCIFKVNMPGIANTG